MNKTLLIIFTIYSFIFSGTLTGNIKFEGNPPSKKLITMDSDVICGHAHNGDIFNESFIIDDKNNLKNVLVWVKNIEYDGEIPINKKIIDQKGCIYKPHILGIMEGQTLLIKNSDATLHNVHSYSKKNNSFNIAMPKVLKETEVLFNKTENPFPIKCDVHPWMKSWIAVFNHPYYTVTDENGNYVIENIPEGKYTIVAFQEKFKMKGIIEKKVEIKNDKSSELNFKFARTKK